MLLYLLLSDAFLLSRENCCPLALTQAKLSSFKACTIDWGMLVYSTSEGQPSNCFLALENTAAALYSEVYREIRQSRHPALHAVS